MPFITQGKANLKYILIVVILAAVVGGGFLAYQYWWLPKQEVKMPEIKPPADETADWKNYKNPEFGYSLKIPPDWIEVEDSDNEQKRFRVYMPGNKDISLCELQILTLSYDDPAVKDGDSKQERTEDFNSALEMSPGVEDNNGRKIQNVSLDGYNSPQFFFNEGNYKYGYSTYYLGENRYISLILFTGTPEIIESYKLTYDLILTTFKFNSFKL